MALWKRLIHETLEEDALDLVESSEQGHNRVLREAPTRGRLTADGSAEKAAVVEPVAVVLALELL